MTTKIFLIATMIIHQMLFTMGQNINIKKIDIHDFNQLRLSNESEKNRLIGSYINSKTLNSEVKKNSQLNLNNNIKIKAGERFLYSSNDFFITEKYDRPVSTHILTKYNYSGNKIAELKLLIEGFVYFNESNGFNESKGNFLFLNIGDGDAFEYTFFNSKFQNIGSYVPFEFGFQFTDYSFRGDNLAIVSRKSLTSNSIKVALFQDLNKIKEVDISLSTSQTPADIKICGNQIIMLLNDLKLNCQKLMCLDFNLQTIWEKKLAFRIIGNEILSDGRKNIFLLDRKNIKKISIESGKELWGSQINTNENSVVTQSLTSEGSYLVVNVGTAMGKLINNNFLELFEVEHGEKVYEEKIGESKDQIELFGGDLFFVLKRNGSTIKYQLIII